jgi:hypothetical protein
MSNRIFSYAQTFAGLILSAPRPHCQRFVVLQCTGAHKLQRAARLAQTVERLAPKRDA